MDVNIGAGLDDVHRGTVLANLPHMRAHQTCVYVLRSETQPGRYYTGITCNVDARLAAHNRGDSTHSASGRPWRLVATVAFTDATLAAQFERYLKSGSGRAFARRHLR